MPKLGRTQQILIISLLTIPELVALVPLAWHYLQPSRVARDSTPVPVSIRSSPARPTP